MVLLLTTQEQVMYFRGYRIPQALSTSASGLRSSDPQGEQIAIAPSVDAAKALIQRKQETEG